MNSYKKLLKNSGIFAIASLGSKLISILLIPYYTYVLNTQQYGTIDMMMTLISLLLPIITFSIFDATLRFSVKSEFDKESIFTCSIFVILVGNILFLIIYPFINNILGNISALFYLIICMQSINTVLAQFCRGIGEVKFFAINGVINTIITVVLNIVLLSKLHMGISGYFISIAVAYIICNIYISIKIKVWNYLHINKISFKLIREMLKFSGPLIPNALMWWIMNLSDRYAIIIFLGVSSNGIYAIANKVPTILNLLYSIFSQAWQLSAIEESDNRNKIEFYSRVFNILSILMLVAASAMIVLIKPTVEIILSNEYIDAWRYIPILLLAVIFSSFSAFWGCIYIVTKETKSIFKTSLIGAIINIVLNLILISFVGLNGAAIATMISFFIVWIMRIVDSKIKIKINIKKIATMLGIIFIQIIFLHTNFKYYLFVELVCFLLILAINKKIGTSIILKLQSNIQ